MKSIIMIVPFIATSIIFLHRLTNIYSQGPSGSIRAGGDGVPRAVLRRVLRARRGFGSRRATDGASRRQVDAVAQCWAATAVAAGLPPTTVQCKYLFNQLFIW